ncbi:MAG: Twin-arginine translocation protein TatB [uncultured Sulfurovum sp.]|uniref:Sec-independent protein translocase protein TatB homolog n=1 Tax=uncultured Sulfurovum sp. TaxID=269237 RepID=A0A6S6SSS9_9BACT|nr:MAG: Twin-arginine translocation protein TatB [uncultured Sulfurovum sp.]
MFGIGFTELLLISILAILFLGPDKLPGAIVEVGKFIKSVKKTVSEAKSSLEEEINIADLKEEALSYKKQLNDATEELKGFKNLDFDDYSDESYDDEISTKSAKELSKPETPKETKKTENEPHVEEKLADIETKKSDDVVTFKKEKKIAKTTEIDKSMKSENEKKGDA